MPAGGAPCSRFDVAAAVAARSVEASSASTTTPTRPRTTAAGTPRTLPLTRSAAAAISSARARAVTASSRPSASTPPRRSSTTCSPCAPSAKSTCPTRQGRPAVSLSTTPTRTPCRCVRAAWSRSQTPSGSRGSSSQPPRSPVLLPSTPAAAMTGPALALTMRVRWSPARRSATTWSVSPAMTRSLSGSSATSPSALLATLLESTTTSPSASVIPEARRPRSTRSARSSPLRTSGMPRSGVIVTEPLTQ